MRWDELTPIEQRVVRLLCQGLTVRQIARRLALPTPLVQAHLERARSLLAVESETALVLTAVEELGVAAAPAGDDVEVPPERAR